MAREGGFAGVIAPVLTPFGEDGNPDGERFTEHAHWLLATGCTALAPFGTTSEANSLGLDERMELLEELVDDGIDPSSLMPGTGTCSRADTVVLTRHAIEKTGAPVSEDEPVVRVGDLSSVRFRTSMGAREVGRVRVGMDAEIRLRAFPGTSIAGKVASVAGAPGSPTPVTCSVPVLLLGENRGPKTVTSARSVSK